jgi:hypothetical protein
MKHKEIRLFTIIFLLLSLAGAYLTFNAFSNQSLATIVENSLTGGLKKELAKQTNTGEKSQLTDGTVCSTQPKLLFNDSIDTNLLRLNKYQKLCNSFASNRLMIFTDMPTSNEQGVVKGKQIAAKLLEFKKYAITPIVIAEPTDGLNKISIKQFSLKTYEEPLDTYFRTIKEQGIDDSSIGTWVPFPEPNVPYWNFDSAVPADFGTNINIYVGVLKKYFKAKASILLNSQTYVPEDVNWEFGSYETFIPYIKNIKTGILDSFGVQGLPWVSPANTKRREQFAPKEFLQPELTVEASKLLKVREVWFNTGTFSEKYTNDPNKTARVSIASRKTMLSEILAEAENVQNAKFDVWINLFAEDKSYLTESTNWSYFNSLETQSILKEFITKSIAQDVKLAIFDREII